MKVAASLSMIAALLTCAHVQRLHAEMPGDTARFVVGSPEWIRYWIDMRGGGLQHGFDVSRLKCPSCGRDRCVALRANEDPDTLHCNHCGFVLSLETLPIAGADTFDGMPFEYALVDGKKYFFLPALRYERARTAPAAASRLMSEAARSRQRKEPHLDSARKALDIMLAYGDYYKKYICERNGGGIFRRGWPLPCNYGRIRNFGDVYQVYAFCHLFRQAEECGLDISTEDRVRYRSFMENMISEVSLPYMRQTGGMGNPLPGIYGDCLIVGLTFPEARIVDHLRGDRILSGVDLVHDAVYGVHGFYQYVSNTTYADGLAKERSSSYNHMISKGLGNFLNNRLPLYETPPDYDPIAAGYGRLSKEDLNANTALLKARFAFCDVTTPDGVPIPIGDSNGLAKQTLKKDVPPLARSRLFPGWGMGVLKMGAGENAAVSVLNWGSTRDGHSHNDLMSLLFWADSLLMLNTTEYPAGTNWIAWWRESAAAHNTAIIDAENPPRTFHQSLECWAPSDHASAIQAFARPYADPAKSIRRTNVLIDSRPGKIPYLVDLVELTGSSTYDLCFQAQSRGGEAYETLMVTTPQLQPSTSANLRDRLRAPANDALATVTALAEAPLAGNAVLDWAFPSGDSLKHLRGIFLPAPNETLFTGDAIGVRYLDLEMKDGKPNRSVRKVVRHAEGKDCIFISVFESRRNAEANTIRSAERIPCDGGYAVLVTHDGSDDLVLLARDGRPAVMQCDFAGTRVSFDGTVAVISARDGGLRHTAVGGTTLMLGEKSITLEPEIRGRLVSDDLRTTTAFAAEVPAVVETTLQPAPDLVGRTMIVASETGVGIGYTITDVEAAGDHSRLTLDRPARLGRGFVEQVRDGGTEIVLAGRVVNLQRGLRVTDGRESRLITEVRESDPHQKIEHERSIILDSPFQATLQWGQPLVFNQIGRGDAFIISPVTTGTR